MKVGIANCERCGIEFKWKKSSGIPAKWCSRKCQKIRIDRISKCELCEKEYLWKEGKHKKHSRFCSRKCQYKKTHEWSSKCEFKWKNKSAEKKLERTKELFEKHVVRKNGCWDWNGVIHHSGYAPLKIDKKQTNAHIVSWIIHNGEIPNGNDVLHKCDNRKCTNPNHLFLGTHQDNMKDRDEKKRQSKGEKHYHSVLKENEVKEIKKLLKIGVPCTRIAKEFGVSDGCIWFIKNGISWKHVKDEK